MKRLVLGAMTVLVALVSAAPAGASDGAFDRAWGKDVISGNAETGFEICTVASSCQAGTAGSLAGEMSDPLGAAVDSAGSLYVVESMKVDKFDSSGNFLRAWGKDVIDTGPGDNGTGFEICVPASGDTCKAAVNPGIPGAVGGELGIAYQDATDASNNLYVVDVGANRIDKYDSSGNFLRAWGKDVVTAGTGNTGTGFEICIPANGDTCKNGATGSLGGEMSSPEGVTVDPSGNVYVGDTSNQRVDKFDSSGNFLRAWGKDVSSAGPGNTGTGFEICVAANADTCQAGVAGGLGGELNLPFGAASDSSNNVYVADANNYRIDKYDSSGNFLRAWGKDVVSAGIGNTGTGFEICVPANGDTCKTGSPGSAGGESGSPRALAVDAAGGVYATDGNNARIEKFDTSGAFLLAWGKNVVSAGPGNTGTGFEVCVAANGDTCRSGEDGTLGGEMRAVEGIGVASSGEVYISDETNDRIQKFVDFPPSTGGGGTTTPPASTLTGQRAAALKKCKKKPPGPKRKKCRKKAKRLPL